MLTLEPNNLIFSYENKDESLSAEEFWEKESEAFDKHNQTHVIYMISKVCDLLNIDDLYRAKRMEATIHTDSPMFAWNRRLLKEWLVKNFNF